MKKYIVIAVVLFVTLFVCLFFYDFFKKEYYVILKKDGLIASYDKSNRLSGEALIFKRGIVRKIENYKSGKKEGWSYNFFPNGQLSDKCYYHDDVLDGPKFHYYQNGNLNYQAEMKNNRRFGNFYLYSSDGLLSSYSAFDINGAPFCTFTYKSSGAIDKINSPISSATYSIDIKTNAMVPLHFEEKNQNIRDLFVTIATPPKTRLEITATVNDVPYNNLKIIKNVVAIKNAFPIKGLNNVSSTVSHL